MQEQSLALISKVEGVLSKHLIRCYEPMFGVCPSPHGDNFSNQLWLRDLAVAVADYFAYRNPAVAIQSLRRIFAHQRRDGALPYRVVREYGFFHVVNGLGWLARPAFILIEEMLHGKKELPSFEGEENGAEDTVPVAIIASAAVFASSPEGREFITENFQVLKKALGFFLHTKTDSSDLLAVVTRGNPDWTETIQRKGKLGYVNVVWVRALGLMAFMSSKIGGRAEAQEYWALYRKAKKRLRKVLYSDSESYFRAKKGEDRLDTGATVLGALFFLSPKQMVRAEGTLDQRVGYGSGFVNFEPRYPKEDIFWVPQLFGNGAYHNEFVWPWLTCQNIFVLIKLATTHPDQKRRATFKASALERLAGIASLFEKVGGAPEILEPDVPKIPRRTPFYNPPKYFLASCAAFCGAYAKMRDLGWI